MMTQREYSFSGVARLLLVAALATGLVAIVPFEPGAADGNEAPGNPVVFRSITGGAGHTCALLGNGTVKCWGDGAYGQVGQGDTADRGDGPGEMGGALPVVDLGTGRTATAVTAGFFHTCALLDDGTVKCWGLSGDGQLGLGDTASRGDNPGEMGDNLPAVNLGTGRTATAVTAGGFDTCALLDNGTVKCWGYNFGGQLGQGDTANRGDGPGEMGDNLPAVNLGTGRTATAVTAGPGNSCALLDNATLKCWGYNAEGSLGLGDTASRGDNPGEMGDNLPTVNLGTGRTATAVTAGDYNICALLDNGTVKCWGENGLGSLGLGDTASRGDNPGEMGDNLPTVNLDTGRTATAVTAGGFDTCALLDNGTVKCWGYNAWGQLGQGDTVSRGDQAGEMGDNLPTLNLGTGRTAIAVTAGDGYSCAVLDNATLKCWGSNERGGSLGLGDTANRGDGPGEMGDNLPAVALEGAAVSGTVTEVTSGTPVAGVWVAVLRTNDLSVAVGAITDADGRYSAQVPAGSYFLYLIDPTGTHAPGFYGAPTTVTVADDTLADADPVLNLTRGSITGTVTADATGVPIAGAWAIAINASTGAPEKASPANAAGQYSLDGLSTGNHLVVFVDPTGTHRTEFYPATPDPSSAIPVAVTPGGTTIANGELPPQAPTPRGAALTGTIHGPDDNESLVIAMHAADYRVAAADLTNDNHYYLNVQAGGGYKLAFLDPAGFYSMQWHNNQPYNSVSAAATVTAPAATDANLRAPFGPLTGTLTDSTTGDPIEGVWAVAIGSNGLTRGSQTNGSGAYYIPALPAGVYRAAFIDPSGGRSLEYWDDSHTFADATIFAISGPTGTRVNASLANS